MKINSNFIYDLDAIKEFIFSGSDERTSDVEITETQVKNGKGKLETESRITREVKSTNANKQTVGYDLIKTFMEVLDNIEIDQDLAPLSLGQNIAFNTMVSYGLIKEIKE